MLFMMKALVKSFSEVARTANQIKNTVIYIIFLPPTIVTVMPVCIQTQPCQQTV